MNKEPDVKNKRKKICPKCGSNLWKRDFYLNKDDSLFSQCKECVRYVNWAREIWKKKLNQ